MDWLQDPLDRFQWAVWHFLATIFWAIDRLALVGAVLIHTVRKWITNPNGIIDLVMNSMLQGEGAASLKTFVAGAILLALLLSAFVFILRPLLGSGQSPVDLRKVFLWLALIGYLFSTGGAFFTGLEGFRSQLSSSAYQVAASVNGRVGGAGYNNTGGEVPLNSSQPFSPTVHLFPNTTHVYQGSGGTPEYTGIDVAGAYLFATQEDINGANNGGTGLPAGFERQYFTNDNSSPWPSNYNADQRQAALNKAVTGVIRMGTGIVPSMFAIQQAIIFLALALAAAILIFSVPISLVFAFFTSTEVITLSLLRAYISLLVKTYVTSMVLAIFMGFLKFWADSQNWVAFLGMSLLIAYFTLQLARMAVGTITQSLNVVTQAIGEATGTRAMYLNPPKMAVQGMGLAATVGLAAATGGAGLAAGSLLSGMGDMGANVPGMRTLSFGLATKSRKTGQIAQEALNRSNRNGATTLNGPQPTGPQPTGPQPTVPQLTGPQLANNHLKSLGVQPLQTAQPVQPAGPTSSTVPPQPPVPPSPAATPSMSPASSPTGPATGAGSEGKGTPNLAEQTPSATANTNGANGAKQPQHRQASRNPNLNKKPPQTVSQPSQLSQPAQQASGSSSTPAAQPIQTTQPEEPTQNSTTSQEAQETHKPGLEGFAGLAPYTSVRTGSSRNGTIGTALADMVRQGESAQLPLPLASFSGSTQVALLEIAKRGYQPEEVSAITEAAESVVRRLHLQKVSPTAVSRLFLGKDGRLDMESRGVRDIIQAAGAQGQAWTSDPQRKADLPYIIGASLQLERTHYAQDIRAAVGRAVQEGGTADTAAGYLGASPSAAWGGRYGSVGSVIARSPAFGLSSAGDVQRFVALAQGHPVDELAVGQASGLAPDQQALLDMVRTRAAEIVATERGDASSEAGQSILKSYLRDVRNIPGRVTAPIVPVPPPAPNATTSEEEAKS